LLLAQVPASIGVHVNHSVFSLGHNDQVFLSVVIWDAVVVMYFLTYKEKASNLFLDNETVSHDVTVSRFRVLWSIDPYMTTSLFSSSSLPITCVLTTSRTQFTKSFFYGLNPIVVLPSKPVSSHMIGHIPAARTEFSCDVNHRPGFQLLLKPVSVLQQGIFGRALPVPRPRLPGES
jgi:hypothetical protein